MPPKRKAAVAKGAQKNAASSKAEVDIDAKAGGDNAVDEKMQEEVKPKRARRGKEDVGKAGSSKDGEGDEIVDEQEPTRRTPHDSSSEDEKVASPPKRRRGAAPKAGDKKITNKISSDYEAVNYNCDRQNKNGEKSNFKIASWNVDGIRAWLTKKGMSYITHESPDILCLQETKCGNDKLPNEIKNIEGYEAYWVESTKNGYAGVGLLSKTKPIKVIYGIENEAHDEEGRCITAEFENFYVVSVYVPNAGRKLVTLSKRLAWNEAFSAFIKKLDKKKPVIICGDLNVAHEEIDLANPKTNQKNAGFSPEEREGMTQFLSDGYVDSFRKFYPDLKKAYTFWSYISNARAKNIGWRLDYFLVSTRYFNNICDNVIRSEIYGSDHCPIVLFLHV